MRRQHLHSILAALLLWASLPAWAAQSAAGHGASLACVHACALRAAQLTQGGRMAALGQQDCTVRVAARAVAVTPRADRHLSASAALAQQPAPAAPAPLALQLYRAAPRRGPPAYGGYLWSQHPQAQAPPQL